MQHEGRRPRVHFSGIGGTGMVAGARLAVEAGWEVRGSDTPLYPPTSEMVAALRAPVTYAYDAANLDWSPDVVVAGNALSRGNPEVECALERRMRMMSLPEWLKEHVLRPRRPIVISGTHGKTTTTALTAFVLDRCGLAPGFFIGGQPLDYEHSARLGAPGAPFVIEGDEYDSAFFDKRAKFLHYLPEVAVATSVEFDHGDIYAHLAEIETAFQRMLRQVPRSGWLIACADNHAASLLPHAFSRTATYGFTEGATWRGELAPAAQGRPHVRVYREGVFWADIEPSLKGRHNQQNALAAVAVAGILGAAPEAVADALRTFRGVRRRMEVFLEAAGITYLDDFAHHPTAIRETIAAARDFWPDRRVRVLFEPRSNTTVTKRFQQDMLDAFSGAHQVWLGPVYRVERIPEEERLDRDALAASLGKRGVPCRAANSVAEIVAEVRGTEQRGDVVLILSNGAFGGIYRQFQESHAASV
ncbi:MAG: UDP-N-acetylmuramate:L-alanyl-gamma-D-glutamyl-meso-diaminopimelate ligase [Candidatus Hydrogenedentes bacterium]|nr:UDP-N-acetylmuramate:L-alanyl-gamma-D-glutamyl-meso-diaminopimelate ligase [Candidatus Hydrogenedentota bacterium]